MTAEHLFIALITLLYLLCGVGFTLCFILNYKPEENSAKLGLMILFWLPIAFVDAVLDIVKPLGGNIKTLSDKVVKKTR